MIKKPISADSHITELPNCYVDYIDPAFRDRALRMQTLEKVGDAFNHRGHEPARCRWAWWPRPARSRPRSTTMGLKFESLLRSGWDPKYRLADQDKDGPRAELIYPTCRLLPGCNHRDFDFKKACFEAYNRWLAEYCSGRFDRLLHGLAQVFDAHAGRRRAELRAVEGDGFQGRDDARRTGPSTMISLRSTIRSGRRR